MFEIKKDASKSIVDVSTGKREIVTGFATYSSPDRDKDLANMGMFTKSWKEFTDVRLFENHDKTKAPGKILKLWEDTEHAYAQTKMGTHTLGEDVLKMADEGIITDSSYVFVPIKQEKLKSGGYSYKEVFHKEVSLLTHWGSHPESKIMSVKKSYEGQLLNSEIAKQLSVDEKAFLLKFINSEMIDLAGLVSFAATLNETSDLYSWVNSIISDISYTISRFKDRIIYYGQKDWNTDELNQRVKKLISFANNSTASDECLQNVLKEAKELESFLNNNSTAQQQEKSTEQQQEVKLKDSENLQLLNLNLLLQS